MRTKWLNSRISELNNSVPGFANFDVHAKGKIIIQHVLLSDMNFSGAGVFPKDIDTLNQVTLPGPYFLQVDEVVDVNFFPQDIMRVVPVGILRGVFKLSMTDGFRPIKDLHVLAPAGFKVMIRNVTVRCGFLTLVSGVLFILGGKVEDLEAQRKKFVEERPSCKRMLGVKTALVVETPNKASHVGCNTICRLAAGFNEISLAEKIGRNPAYYDLASLLSDWAEIKDEESFIQSYIKCIMTGIRRFQYQFRTTYELIVYADDGSRMSEVCIHHIVVESQIGCSVAAANAALSSPDKNVRDKMTETLMAFETMFNFQGTLLVEINKNCTIPVALQMTNEDSETFDASWILRGLRRKKPRREWISQRF
ncbi:hypothetical protein MKX03_022844 [Papaver bracteatum]|nr:hypothetical protein MKX03_022844 [Papaver bracteatum]